MTSPPGAGPEKITGTAKELFMRSLNIHQTFHEQHDSRFLLEAISCAQQSLRFDEPYDPASTLSNLGRWLNEMYDQTQDRNDLDQAVLYCEQAVSAALPTHPNRPIMLDSLARRLFDRYEVSRDEADLTKSINLGREALNACEHLPGARPSIMNGLSSRLRAKFKAHPNIVVLEEAIRLGRDSVELTPSNSLNDLASRCTNLGSSLSLMFDETREEKYLTEAIGFQRDAKSSTEPKSQMLPARLCNLGNALGKKYQLSYKFDELKQSLECHQQAVDRIKSSNNRTHWQNIIDCYSIRLFWRFEHTGDESSLSESLIWAQELVDKTNRDHPLWPQYVSNRCNKLITRYELRGNVKDLQDAVAGAEDALVLVPADSHPVSRALVLCTLGHALRARYRRTGAMSDLEQAVSYAKHAVDAIPSTHARRAFVLENLSLALSARYDRLKEGSDLDDAIHYGQEATDEAYEKDKKGIAYSNVGILYGTRYRRDGKSEDLNMALSSCEKALELGRTHFSRFVNLGHWLQVSFQSGLQASYDVLNRAVDLFEKALTMTETMTQCPERSIIALNIADARETRFRSQRDEGDPSDRARSKRVLNDVLDIEASPPADRINCALFLASIASSEDDWAEVYKATKEAIKLLPFVSPRCIDQKDQQYSLSQFSGLACRAAAAALCAQRSALEALQLLEAGRCVISNHRFERRVDVSHLRNVRPNLAKKFEDFCYLLESEAHGNGIMGSSIGNAMSTRYRAETDLLSLINKIHDVEELKDFLAPKKPNALLENKRSSYIVVINVSFRSDVFLVRESGVELLPLKVSIRSQAIEYAKKLHSRQLLVSDLYHILEWLWDTTIWPILEALEISTPPTEAEWPRICWIPTGPLSSLPLHAAGYHLDGSRRTVLDLAVSSYSPSIKFLEYSFENNLRLLARPTRRRHRALIASMAYTNKMRPLRHAREKSKAVGRLLQPCVCINEVEQPSKLYIRKELHLCTIFHFAGHAKADPVDPLQSCLAVDDGFVTVEDLVDEKLYLDPPLLAYLSACSTGSIQVESLVEEGIHLAGTFLAAGFQNVIASLWNVSDSQSSEVAKLVYESMVKTGLKNDSVAVGLHHSLRDLRMKDIAGSAVPDLKTADRLLGLAESDSELDFLNAHLDRPYSWVSYIHMGYY